MHTDLQLSSNDATTLAVAAVLLRQYSHVPEEILEYMDRDTLLRMVMSLIPWMCAQLRSNSCSSGQNCPEATVDRGLWKSLYDIRKHLQTTLSANAKSARYTHIARPQPDYSTLFLRLVAHVPAPNPQSARFKDLDQLSPQAVVAGTLAEACEGLNEEKYVGLTNTLDLYAQTCQKMTEELFLRRIRNVNSPPSSHRLNALVGFAHDPPGCCFMH